MVVDAVVFSSHLLLNIFPLHGWAKGNLFMMTYSYFTFYMTVFGIMLLLGQPGYMMAPKSTR